MKVGSRFLFYTYDYEDKKGIVYLITLLIIPRGIQFNISKFTGILLINGPNRGERVRLRKKVTLKYVMTTRIAHRFYNIGSFKIMKKSDKWDNLCVLIKNGDLKSIYSLLNQWCPNMIMGELKFSNLIQVNDTVDSGK